MIFGEEAGIHCFDITEREPLHKKELLHRSRIHWANAPTVLYQVLPQALRFGVHQASFGYEVSLHRSLLGSDEGSWPC